MKEEDMVLDKNPENKEPKKIEVVTGNGDLTISPVYEHLEVEKPKPKENRTIVVPEVKDNISKEKEEPLEEENQEAN